MLRKGLFILLVLLGLLLGGLARSYEYTVRSEHRWGKDLDKWEEKGSASVTETDSSFNKGVRLTGWADGEGDDYEYAIVYAEYRFAVPSGARSMRIYISYDGDDGKGVAGRLWLRRRGSSEGDSFLLRARQRSETIRLSVDDYLISEPWIELRVVAEGSQRIDVEYIKVDFYSSSYNFRVATRYYTDYVWRPWWRYTYWYYYPGRHLYWDPLFERWVVYRYPRYSYHWGLISNSYNSYLRGYYDGLRDERSRWRWQARTGGPRDIVAWSSRYADAHRAYRDSAGDVRGSSARAPRERVRSVLVEHKRRRGGTSVWADMDRTSDSTPAKAEVRRGDASTLKQRREVIGSPESTDRLRQSPRSEGTKVRSGSAADLKHFRETSDARTGTSRETSRSSVKTRSGSSVRRSGTSFRSSEGAAAAREVRQEPRATRARDDSSHVKVRRREVREVRRERKEGRSAPQLSKQAPSRQVKDDDNEEQKRRAAASRSASSGSGSSRKRRTR